MSKSLHHSFDIHVAALYGVDGAILIHHFQHWIQFNSNKGTNRYEGRTWTYQTLEDIQAHFPYYTKRQVERIISNLVKDEVILKGNFNKTKMDRTVWYAFKNQETFIKSRNGEIEKTEWGNQNHETVTAIPDTIQDTKTDNDDDARAKPEKPKPEILPKVDANSVFCHLQGLVGRSEAEILWMNAARQSYDLEPVVRHCMSAGTVKRPAAFIQDAISHRKDYSNKAQEAHREPSQAKRVKPDTKYVQEDVIPAERLKKADKVWSAQETLNCAEWCEKHGYENPHGNSDGWVEVWIEKTGQDRAKCLAKRKMKNGK